MASSYNHLSRLKIVLLALLKLKNIALGNNLLFCHFWKLTSCHFWQLYEATISGNFTILPFYKVFIIGIFRRLPTSQTPIFGNFIKLPLVITAAARNLYHKQQATFQN